MQEILPDGTIVMTPMGVGQVADHAPNHSGTDIRYTVHLGNGDIFYFWSEKVTPVQSGMQWIKTSEQEPVDQDANYLICIDGKFVTAELVGEYWQPAFGSIEVGKASHWMLIEKPNETS